MSQSSPVWSQVIEAILLAAHEPVSLGRLHELIREESGMSQADLKQLLDGMQVQYQSNSGLTLQEVASGYRLQVKAELMPWITAYFAQKPQKVSRALLETMAVIAYHQPVTRGDIESMRGVSNQHHVLRQLFDRDWIKVVGHKQVPGKPELLGTSKGFLNDMNLKSLADLPESVENG